jgi:hypothetical protein
MNKHHRNSEQKNAMQYFLLHEKTPYADRHFLVEGSGYRVTVAYETLAEATRILTERENILQHHKTSD